MFGARHILESLKFFFPVKESDYDFDQINFIKFILMKLFHTKSLLAGDIPKSLTSEDNSARILTNLTDDRFKAHWRELIRGNDLRGFPLGKIIGKENKLFSLGPVVKFYFWPADETQAKDDPTRIISLFSW